MSRLQRRLLSVGLATLVGLAILISLGVWQLQRLEWKQELIAAASSRVDRTPQPLPAPALWEKLEEDSFIYRPVRATGEYLPRNLYAYTTLSDPQNGPYGGQGYWVMTPLALEEGGIVFINRGFIPLEMKDAFARRRPPAGRQEIAGLMKPDETPGLFTPEPDVEDSIFYARHIGAMREAADLSAAEVAPFYVDALASGQGGLPQAGETRLSFVNNHLGYAMTWFGLALTLIGVAGAFMLKIRRDAR